MTADLPDDDIEGTRSALAPMLAAAQAVLPWLPGAQPARFAPALNRRWIAAARQLAQTWSASGWRDMETLRRAMLALYQVALDSADADCIALGEALASAVDQLDTGPPSARLLAALSAALECFGEAEGLEHPAFAPRARHFAQRLGDAAVAGSGSPRSLAIDRLFVGETEERLARMADALAALPADAVLLKEEAAQIAEQAQGIELYGLMHLARQLAAQIGGATDFDEPRTRARLDGLLQQLRQMLAAVLPG